LLAAMAMVLWTGWGQHFGGLEEARKYFYAYTYPNLTEVNPDQLKRINSNRIFGTLFYPNSLAGAVLLLTPALVGGLAEARRTFTAGARALLIAALLVAAGGCLLWSGSKTGWLLALAMGLAVLLRWPLARKVKVALVAVVLLAGLAGFVARYAGFFQKGATSVVARFDYWRAGLTMIGERPLFGAGPGLFGAGYKRLKPPEAEMAQLAHNDYLQQAVDSGLPAAVLFAGLVAAVAWRGRWWWSPPGWLEWGVWLGLLALAAQSLVEFGFMVPATAWCWFGLAGWWWRRTIR
jgi:O-antigen ligase